MQRSCCLSVQMWSVQPPPDLHHAFFILLFLKSLQFVLSLFYGWQQGCSVLVYRDGSIHLNEQRQSGSCHQHFRIDAVISGCFIVFYPLNNIRNLDKCKVPVRLHSGFPFLARSIRRSQVIRIYDQKNPDSWVRARTIYPAIALRQLCCVVALQRC